MAAAFVPTGWPDGVHPPGTSGFEQTAVNWLLDQVPPDYRLHGVLVRHPVALAALTRHHLAACVDGARQGYRGARAELGDHLPPGGLAAVLAAYQTEGRRLVAAATAADLISRALHGETFVPQLGDVSRPPEGAAAPGRKGRVTDGREVSDGQQLAHKRPAILAAGNEADRQLPRSPAPGQDHPGRAD